MNATDHLLYILTNNPVDFETFKLDTIHILKLTCKDLKDVATNFEEKAVLDVIRGNGKFSDVMYKYVMTEAYIDKYKKPFGDNWIKSFKRIKRLCYNINLLNHFDWIIEELIDDEIIKETDEEKYRDELWLYTTAPPQYRYSTSASDCDDDSD